LDKYDPVVGARIRREDKDLLGKVARILKIRTSELIRNIIGEYLAKFRSAENEKK